MRVEPLEWFGMMRYGFTSASPSFTRNSGESVIPLDGYDTPVVRTQSSSFHNHQPPNLHSKRAVGKVSRAPVPTGNKHRRRDRVDSRWQYHRLCSQPPAVSLPAGEILGIEHAIFAVAGQRPRPDTRRLAGHFSPSCMEMSRVI